MSNMEPSLGCLFAFYSKFLTTWERRASKALHLDRMATGAYTLGFSTSRQSFRKSRDNNYNDTLKTIEYRICRKIGHI